MMDFIRASTPADMHGIMKRESTNEIGRMLKGASMEDEINTWIIMGGRNIAQVGRSIG